MSTHCGLGKVASALIVISPADYLEQSVEVFGQAHACTSAVTIYSIFNHLLAQNAQKSTFS